MSMTPYSDEFMEAKVNNIYRGDPNLGGSGVYVNMTIKVCIIQAVLMKSYWLLSSFSSWMKV